MNSRKTIWIVEDDKSAQFVYRECLDLRYDLKFSDTLGAFKEELASVKEVDLILADLRLEDESFLDFLSKESEALRNIPFIVVSSVDDLDALRLCYRQGAADYLTKPFGKSELIVKVDRYLSKFEEEEHHSAPFQLDPTRLIVQCGDKKSAPLTSKEFQILTTLERAPQHRLTRQELINHVWREVHVEKKTLDVHLCNLRKKLTPIGIEIVFYSPESYVLLCHGVNA